MEFFPGGLSSVFGTGLNQGSIAEPSNLVALFSYTENAAAVCTPRKAFASAGYQVPAGKSLRILAIRYQSTSVSTQGPDQIGYCDNDCGFGTSTARTNAVNLWGNTSNTGRLQMFSSNVLNNGGFEVGFPNSADGIVVPTGKYLFSSDSQAGTHHMIIIGVLI